MADWERLREHMVNDLRRMGIQDSRVLEAMGRVPRHHFVPGAEKAYAYVDGALSIGLGQTISQPYMVAAMTQALALTGTERVLEIGTGSGYQTAVLAELATEVVTVERIPELYEAASGCLAALGYRNVRTRLGDGTLGVPEEAPFDAVLVTAGAPNAPQPLLDQLAEGGRLVIPTGSRDLQTLLRYEKHAGHIIREALMACVFVPLVGRYGWDG